MVDINEFQKFLNRFEKDNEGNLKPESYNIVTLDYFGEATLEPLYFQEDLKELIQDFYSYIQYQSEKICDATESLEKLVVTSNEMNKEFDELSKENTRLVKLINDLNDDNDTLKNKLMDDVSESTPYIIQLDKVFLYSYILLGCLSLFDYFGISSYVVNGMLMLPVHYFTFVSEVMYFFTFGLLGTTFIHIVNVFFQIYLYMLLKSRERFIIEVD